MRTIERQGKAWQKMLRMAEMQPVQVSFRGLDDTDNPLFEVKYRGAALVVMGTERQLLAGLTGEEKALEGQDATVT